MPQQLSPFLEGKYGWNYGEAGWNTGIDENLLKFSFMFDRNIDSITASLPSAVNGQAHYLTTDNRIYFAVGSTYYSTPVPKNFIVFVKSTGDAYQFNGTSLTQVDSHSQIDSRLDAIEVTVSSLGTAAFEDISAFATQANLDVVSAQANDYTDKEIASLGIVSVMNFIDTAVDGVTSNQAGIVAAVAAAVAAGADLLWPAGTYVSDANIPNFHSVRHFGPGVVRKGAATYAVKPQGLTSRVNNLYVDSLGLVGGGGDGLTPETAFPTIQSAFDALANAGDTLYGNWYVHVAAGTYREAPRLTGVRSVNRLTIQGPEVNGAMPTVYIDGDTLSLTSLAGMSLTQGIYAVVRNIRFLNWTGASGVGDGDASTGLSIIGSNVWVDNVWAYNCGTAVSAVNSRLYQGRGTILSCSDGTTAFGTTVFSLGYGGATTYSSNFHGINIRDGSSGVVDGGVFDLNNIGLRTVNQSHTRVSNCAFTNSTTSDTYSYTGSSLFFGLGNTFTPGKKFRGEFALDLGTAGQFYYNADLDRFNFGAQATPAYKFHFRKSVVEGAIASLASILGVEGENPQIGFNGTSTSTFGFTLATPATATAAGLYYTAADGNWRIRANDVDSYRISPTTIRPVVDNAVSLGLAAARFSTVYAGTGTINTSDGREKRQVRELSTAERAVATRLKGLIRAFKFNDAVALKGDSARIHFGVIAQDVKSAFEAEGLVAEDYAILCYDEWEETPEEVDSDGNVVQEYRAAGNRYGVRYEELLAFIISSL